MRTAYIISGIGHAAVVLWSVFSFAAKPLVVPPGDALPVDIVSVSEFTQMTAGSKSAPKAEAAKPLVEKVAEAKPVEDPTAKVVEKKEVKAAREPPPAPEAKPVETKPEKKTAEVKPDPIADALAKEEAKNPEPKKAEAKPPTPPKKPAPPAPKFDPKQIEQKLLNKLDATRLATAGATPNNVPSLGLERGTAAQLAQDEFSAFVKKLGECWTPPPGVNSTTNLHVIIRVLFKADGSVAAPPQVVLGPASPLGPAMAESAKRALLTCQPFKMLSPERYDQWKDLEINFDPREMFRG
jgi:outer membrane biosynthesis protein TonB